VYLPVLRSLLPEEFSTFDFPDPHQIVGQREVTTVAPQALFFLNSEFVEQCARGAAERLLDEEGLADSQRIRVAYLRIVGREPDVDEVDAAVALLAQLQPPPSTNAPQHYRWAVLVQALMSSAEFRYVR
jgi:hypothetical protein